MKNIFLRSLIGLCCLQLACKSSTDIKANPENSSIKQKTIKLHPPVADLSTVHGLEESPYFDLKVNGEDAFVYHSKEIRDEHEHRKQGNSISYQGVSYVNFSTTKEVNLEITSFNNAENWSVMPETGIKVNSKGNSLKLTLDKPRKFVVTATIDDKEEYFIISAEQPETNIPSKDDDGVLYLEAGVHKYGQAWDPYVNGIHTVYISGGAVVEATINSKNKNNIKLLGRGLLSQSFVTHAEESVEHAEEQEWDADWLGVVFTDSENIEIDGIAIMSSPSYQLEFANSNNVSVRNIKLCGFGEHNNDGLHTYGKNIDVSDSFIASNDDRICITGLYDKGDGKDGIEWDGSNALTGVPAENISIKDMVFLGLDNNGGDIMLTWNGAGYAKNIRIENVVSLTPTNKAFIAARHGGSADIHDLIIKNVTLLHGNLFDVMVGGKNYQGAGGGKLRNMLLENVIVEANNTDIGKQLMGASSISTIENISLNNIMTKDGMLNSFDQLNIDINEFVKNIRVVE